MTECVTLELPVYKGDASGDLIESGDALTFIINNDDGTEETQDVTVTAVSNGGKTVCWDREVTDFRSSDIVRVGAEHEWECPTDEDAELQWTHGAIADVATVDSVDVNGTVVALDPVITIPLTGDAARAAAEQQLQSAFIEAGGNGTLTVTDWTAADFKVYLTNTTLGTGDLVINATSTAPGAITMTFSVAVA